MICAPRFYADGLGPAFVATEDALAGLAPRRLRPVLARSGLVRGVALGLAARRGSGIAVIRRARGSVAALVIAALPPARRRIFVLELLRRPPPPGAGRRGLLWAWTRLIERPALRRAAAGVQVMTAWEREDYARDYGLDPARVHHVGWPWREGREGALAEIREDGRSVFCSGRSACDWETVFASARDAGWDLVAACSRADLSRVRALARGSPAEVHVELPWPEHDRLLRASAVCAIVLEDRPLSSGQARLMSAVEAGVPVVATAVAALGEYVVADETAVTVPPGDPGALRDALEALLADPIRRRQLRDAAFARAGDWTYVHYFSVLRGLICDSLAADPPAPQTD